LQTGFINAQRGLDDEARRTSEVLSGILQNLFNNARLESANQEDRDIAKGLESAVQGIQTEIDGDFQKKLSSLLPAFGLFGYPGLPDPQLCTETTLDVDRLLTNHTRVRYVGVNGVTLPESYNGLGVRNLIYILLRLLQFFKDFKAKPLAPGVHLVFIEEPEVHLHPQMQEVFIRQLEKVVDTFNKQENDGPRWPVQFVVTTHSSHIANEAPFSAMRYFLSKRRVAADGYSQTHIKDLRKGILDEPEENRRFLHEFMTLTRCDLLFADKAVLIEGTAERLLLPRMIEKVEATKAIGLRNKYISTIEVGGAYAHRFFKLLEFLELRTLIITDLDSGRENENHRIAASKVSEGTHTTNACLKTWFGDAHISPGQLIQKPAGEKTVGFLHLEYQVPEVVGMSCGRTFEDALMLANPKLFGLTGKDSKDQEEEIWKKMEGGIDKVEFALYHAINTTDWIVPRYIQDGLCWLGELHRQSGAYLAQAIADRRGKAAGDA
jgi:putative ATP-dependent endonuclease of OLD family